MENLYFRPTVNRKLMTSLHLAVFGIPMSGRTEVKRAEKEEMQTH